VPKDANAGDFVATVAGGVAAPRYVDGKTSLSEWRSTIRHRPAPWAEIENSKVILTVPSTYVRDLDDPAALMAGVGQDLGPGDGIRRPSQGARAARAPAAGRADECGRVQHAGFPS